MFYDKEITILSDEGYLNDSGRWVDGELVEIKTIECDVQPYSTELAYRDYGYDKDVKYRAFLNPEPLIELGTVVEYMNEQYNVVKIVYWDDYWIILIDN